MTVKTMRIRIFNMWPPNKVQNLTDDWNAPVRKNFGGGVDRFFDRRSSTREVALHKFKSLLSPELMFARKNFQAQFLFLAEDPIDRTRILERRAGAFDRKD